jgi:hypothetical protein
MSTTDTSFLSVGQRAKLLEFIGTVDAIFGARSFDPDLDYSDPGLIALALRDVQLLGLRAQELEQFFAREFGLADITSGDLGAMLAIAMLVDAERRIKVACGGRNWGSDSRWTKNNV